MFPRLFGSEKLGSTFNFPSGSRANPIGNPFAIFSLQSGFQNPVAVGAPRWGPPKGKRRFERWVSTHFSPGALTGTLGPPARCPFSGGGFPYLKQTTGKKGYPHPASGHTLYTLFSLVALYYFSDGPESVHVFWPSEYPYSNLCTGGPRTGSPCGCNHVSKELQYKWASGVVGDTNSGYERVLKKGTPINSKSNPLHCAVVSKLGTPQMVCARRPFALEFKPPLKPGG